MASGAPVTITVGYIVPASTPAGTVTNTATVSSSTDDPDLTNNSASDTNTVTAASADVSVTKTDNVTQVTAGDGVTQTFSITVHNSGPSAAADVTLIDTWPPGYLQLAGSIVTTQGSCIVSSPPDFTCHLGALASGATVTITVGYIVPASTPAGTVTNTATVSSSTDDPDLTNNSASDTNTVTAASADVSVTKTVVPAVFAKVGDTLAYTVTATSTGTVPLTDVVVSDPLIDGLASWSCTPPTPADLLPGETVVCTARTRSRQRT